MTARPALFASAFHPHVGGVEELVRQLAMEQTRRGMRPVVLTNRQPKHLSHRDSVDGIPVSRHSFRVRGGAARQLAGWSLFSGATHLAVTRELRSLRSDLVHVQCVSSNASYALSASRLLRLPLVVTMQGELTMDAAQVYQRSAKLRDLWRRSLDRADVVTGCSRYVLDEAQAAYGGDLSRARVIHNGISLADYDDSVPTEGAPFVLGLGRMVRVKGFDLLVDAFARLASSWPDLRLVLAGDGDARAPIEDQVLSLGLTSRVDFLGRVDHARAVALLQQASAFALPSHHEPQGIVVLEAMAARTPVVAADVGGVAEIVDHERNGLLFPGGSADGLAEALERVLEDTSLIARLVTAGRATAAAHDWSETASAYSAAYADASP